MFQSLRKGINRLGTRIKQAAGKQDKTVDDEYDRLKEEIGIIEKQYYKINHEMKSVLEAMRHLSHALKSMTDNVKAFYGPQSAMEMAAAQFCQSISEIENLSTQMIKLLDSIERLKRIMEDRTTARLDYDYYRKKYDELVEKNNDRERIARNKEKMDQAAAIFEEINSIAVAECDHMYTNRFNMFDNPFFMMMTHFYNFFVLAGTACHPLHPHIAGEAPAVFEGMVERQEEIKARIDAVRAGKEYTGTVTQLQSGGGAAAASDHDQHQQQYQYEQEFREGADNAADELGHAAVSAATSQAAGQAAGYALNVALGGSD